MLTSGVNSRSGSLSTVTYVEVMAQIDQRFRDNRRMNTDEIITEMSISRGKKPNKNI